MLHKHNHWILLAKGLLHTDIVTVYDRLTYRPNERQHVVACMSSLLSTKGRTFKYHVAPCQKQTNDYDCGVYAIAFAVSLAFDVSVVRSSAPSVAASVFGCQFFCLLKCICVVFKIDCVVWIACVAVTRFLCLMVVLVVTQC
jgi:Ulp1 protease family, C-terminal catalytic domain